MPTPTSLTLADGTKMPALGLGTWKSSPGEVGRAVRIAIEVGYRHIDCAAIYGNEAEIGQALAEAFAAGDVARDALWITSKLWNDSHEPKYVRQAIERTLKDLRLDALDLYLIHWPVAIRHGLSMPKSASDFLSPAEMPIETTWESIVALKRAGLTRQVGVSNFTLPKIRAITAAVGEAPAINQVEMHPLLAQRDLLAGCAAMGVKITAYSPLGSPDSARFFGRKDEVLLVQHPEIVRIAAARDATPAQVLIAWALVRHTSVIPKSTQEKRLRENLASQSVTLGEADMKALDALDRGHRYLNGADWSATGSAYTPQWLWG
jgi:alcohol dehydrogenase (NADP+)